MAVMAVIFVFSPEPLDLTCVSSLAAGLKSRGLLTSPIQVLGSMRWNLPVLNVVLSAFGLHKCVDTSFGHMQVEDELNWFLSQAGQPGLEPGGLAH